MATNPITAALGEMIAEMEDGLAVGPDQPQGSLAPSGELYKTFINGRVLDEGTLTDEKLIARMRGELRQYKKAGVNAGGMTIYWRERPDFAMDFVNAPTKVLKCRVAISAKRLMVGNAA